jgi:hypothetical protein
VKFCEFSVLLSLDDYIPHRIHRITQNALTKDLKPVRAGQKIGRGAAEGETPVTRLFK